MLPISGCPLSLKDIFQSSIESVCYRRNNGLENGLDEEVRNKYRDMGVERSKC